MHKILLAYDDSDDARRALEETVNQVHATPHSHVIVIAVKEMPLSPDSPRTFGTAGDIGEWEGQPIDAPEEIVGILQTASEQLRHNGINPELHWAIGEPARAILDAAEASRADTIVMGKHHHGFLGTLFGGDTAAEVRKHTGADVVVA